MNELQASSRRRLLLAGLTVGFAAAAPAAARLIRTPRQSTGPFYPSSLPLDSDNDLTWVQGRSQRAAGVVTDIVGRVLDEDGRSVDAAEIEIWQCDSRGYYHHPRDRGGRADPNFQGFGRTATRSDGGYRFRTIKPVPYPGRAPHIHFRILAPGFGPMTTQMYIAGDPQNDGDFLVRAIRDPAARASVMVALSPASVAGEDVLTGEFVIVLGRNT